MRWMSVGAYNERICGENTGGVSLWLLAPSDYAGTCGFQTERDPKCPPFDLPPGYTELKDALYGVSHTDIVLG